MKKKGANLESSIKKLESEVRLYQDFDSLVKSYREVGGLSEKDIISVIERIKFQVILDGISKQSGMKDKLDRFTRKWNLLRREEKGSNKYKSLEVESESDFEKIRSNAEMGSVIKDVEKFEKKKQDSDSFIKKMKRKFKISRCENCGYFYVPNGKKGIFQCTFFEFSSEVDKKDVCENWTGSKQVKKSFF
ncbi:MAG: hypothetical protein MUP22_01355 [Desulfobacterales bacterium]|nr:hypothetical protein [Desulfobacterales bacterium]